MSQISDSGEVCAFASKLIGFFPTLKQRQQVEFVGIISISIAMSYMQLLCKQISIVR